MNATLEKSQAVEQEDIWGFYLIDRAGEVPCETLERFMALLRSKSTDHATSGKIDTNIRTIPLTIYGPVCEDANMPGAEEFDGRLVAHYTLEKSIVCGSGEDLPTFSLSEQEKRELVKLLKIKMSNTSSAVIRVLGLERY